MDEDTQNLSEVRSFKSAMRRLSTLIEVTGEGFQIDTRTRNNIHADLIELRNFLERYEKFSS